MRDQGCEFRHDVIRGFDEFRTLANQRMTPSRQRIVDRARQGEDFASLFGGEAALFAQVEQDCADLGLTVRAGIADTAGAAWAR